ncbi:helix-turn-helix domain-containing protein [Soonwooa sp.]|uniref:winged helix-turn-helix transcriptional regulator n=1 Tax=Soonwooa sp. TaxID=1938592 RepID=UPI00262BDF78|nr:helix-turn-helix domain-containing protein [Soonwooa sp.]
MARKDNSSNQINQSQIQTSCDLAYSVSLFEKRWALIILCRLENGKMRFNEIYKSIDGISDRMLSLRLKELEEMQLITRNHINSASPHVEYQLTDLGIQLSSIFKELRKFGKKHRSFVEGETLVNSSK